MESTQATLNIAYTVQARIKNLEEKFGRQWVGGIGKDAVYVNVSRGWFINFEGSFESLYFGPDKPHWQEGDEIKITFAKVT